MLLRIMRHLTKSGGRLWARRRTLGRARSFESYPRNPKKAPAMPNTIVPTMSMDGLTFLERSQ